MKNLYLPVVVLPVLLTAASALLTNSWSASVVFVLWVFFSGLGIAVGFHRMFSHYRKPIAAWLDYLMLVAGTGAGQSSSLSWVAVHNGYHHKFADQHQDPHSPVAHGSLHAFVGWYCDVDESTFSHRAAIYLASNNRSTAWLHKLTHRHYFLSFYAIGLVAASVVSALTPVSFWVAVNSWSLAIALSLIQDNTVNVLGHTPLEKWPRWMHGWFVYRRYATPDSSANLPFLSWIGWGQFNHNHHHAHPRDFLFRKPGTLEFDPCVIFKPLVALGVRD